MSVTSNPQLKLAFEFVEYTGEHVFLTGKAGTGKTTFLHNLKDISSKRLIVVAPTGVAAINAGGMTIHSFFQMPFGPILTEDIAGIGSEGSANSRINAHKFNRTKIDIIKSLDLLIIDEVSMVRADLLDGIDEVLRKYKHHSKPFGGVQLLMIGDLQQLAPIVKNDEWGLLKDYYDSMYFFNSRALKKSRYVSIELKEIFRQRDMEFIKLLNGVRENSLNTQALEKLNKQYTPNFKYNDGEGYITLTTHNAQAKNINESRLKKLPGRVYTFCATIEGDFPEYSYPTDFKLLLKKDAQVMFVKNDPSPEKLFYNGKIGKVEKVENEIIYVQCPGENHSIPVERTEWKNTKYSINKDTKEIEESVKGTFTQYPLKHAWAITIHKSQGLTFEKAIIDARAAFAHGQVYVALSRCRTLEGLILSTPITHSCIKSSPDITSYTKSIKENPPGSNELEQAKWAYEKMLVKELFDFSSIQQKVFHALKIIKDNKSIIPNFIADKLYSLNDPIKKEIVSITEKFDNQLEKLVTQSLSIEKNNELQERIKKGSDYFINKLETFVIEPLENLPLDIDNKSVKKSLKEVLTKIENEAFTKKSCLQVSKNGFTVKNYLNTKAKATLEKKSKKSKKTEKTKHAPEGIKHPKLYSELKAWREAKATEEDIPLYMVLPNKAIMELVTYLPTSNDTLHAIKGFGKKKLEKYGHEILEIISHYRESYNIEEPHADILVDRLNNKRKKTSEAKPDTKTASLDLYRSGKNIKEIAKERSLAVSTIEGHLANYVETGELNIVDFVAQEKIEAIIDFFVKNKENRLKPAKDALGDDYSWGELKFVFKHLVGKGRIEL